MKTLSILSVTALVVLTAFSCKNQKSASGSASAPATNTTPAPAPAVSPTPSATTTSASESKADNVRFIASFYSIGQGIDAATKAEFEKFLSSYPKKLNYSPKAWGREGEVDYCLSLSELSSDEQSDFVLKAKKILTNNVRMSENAKAEHKSGPAEQSGNESYRLVVSFFSVGGGINTGVHQQFEKFISGHTPKISYQPTRWGREGEMDYYLKLSELTAAQQEEFVLKTKDIVEKRVHISENEKCKH